MISPGLYDYYTVPVRGDWREVGSYIKENDKGKNSIVLISSLSLFSFKWYNKDKGSYTYCAISKYSIDLEKLFRICKLDDIDHFWVIREQKRINKSYESSYYHNNKGSLFRIVKEGEFVGNNSPVILYSFEKVKE